jgi:hypothetical protein
MRKIDVEDFSLCQFEICRQRRVASSVIRGHSQKMNYATFCLWCVLCRTLLERFCGFFGTTRFGGSDNSRGWANPPSVQYELEHSAATVGFAPVIAIQFRSTGSCRSVEATFCIRDQATPNRIGSAAGPQKTVDKLEPVG